MCLTNIGKKKVATEDIVVYKRLLFHYSLTSQINELDGIKFKGIINDKFVEGTISISNNRLFFCTDNLYAEGFNAIDKKGHKYSWLFDITVQMDTIQLEGKSISDYINTAYYTPYQQMRITLGTKYTSALIINDDNTVDIGFHSFVTKADAIYGYSDIIVKCIIPKGAKYIEGEFVGDPSIASDTIIYTDELIE